MPAFPPLLPILWAILAYAFFIILLLTFVWDILAVDHPL
jgi:hypothetical protein